MGAFRFSPLSFYPNILTSAKHRRETILISQFQLQYIKALSSICYRNDQRNGCVWISLLSRSVGRRRSPGERSRPLVRISLRSPRNRCPSSRLVQSDVGTQSSRHLKFVSRLLDQSCIWIFIHSLKQTSIWRFHSKSSWAIQSPSGLLMFASIIAVH